MTTLTTHTTRTSPGLGRALFTRLANLVRRRKLAPLLYLDDHMLRDMGITREDVLRARNLPLSRDAGEELNRVMLSRRLNR